MKYIITESQVNKFVKKYLDGIEWVVMDYSTWEMTRLFFKDKMQYPEDAIFESYIDEDLDENTHEKVLLVNRKFFTTLKSLFGLTTYALSKSLMEWYQSYTNEKVTQFNFID